MKTIDFKKVKEFIYMLYGLLLIITITTISIANINNDFQTFQPYMNVQNMWVDENNNSIDLSYIADDTVAYKYLNENELNKTLFFRAKNVNVRVYKNDTLYIDYSNLAPEEMAWYKTPGTYYVSVPIDNNDQYIKLEIDAPYKNDSSCSIKGICIGDADKIITSQLVGMLPGFSTCILIIIIGILLCVLSVCLRKYNKQNQNLLSLGLFAIVGGIWSMTETRILQLLFGHSAVVHITASLSLLLFTIPLFIFFRDRGEAKDKLSTFIVGCYTSIAYIVCFILHITGIKDLHETITIAHITVGLSCIIILIYALQIFKKSHFKDFAFWGLVIIGALSGLDIILYYKQITMDNAIFMRIGFLGYVVVMCVQAIENYVKIYSEAIKAEMIAKMAYFDMLTGFYNHNSFSSDLKDMVKHPETGKGKAIIVFDMNCLKYINDNMGHSMGDTALKEASEFINDSFSMIGKCYRIGGDEYTVITNKSTTVDELSAICEEFQRKLVERNATPIEDKPYPLYIACGYEIINDNASEAFSVADARMYDNKVRIKKDLQQINPALIRN